MKVWRNQQLVYLRHRYFGRYSIEKGIDTLTQVCKDLPDVNFISAGTGSMEDKLSGIPNIKNVGFQSGEALGKLIRGAREQGFLSIRRKGTRIVRFL